MHDQLGIAVGDAISLCQLFSQDRSVHGPGRVEENQVENTSRSSQKIANILADDGDVVEAQIGQVLTKCSQRLAALLHEDHPTGSPGHGLDADAARTRIEIEHGGSVDQAGQGGENAFPRSIGQGTGLTRIGADQPPSFGTPCDNPH